MRKILNILLVAAFIFVAAPFKNSNAGSPFDFLSASDSLTIGPRVFTDLTNLIQLRASVSLATGHSVFVKSDGTQYAAGDASGFRIRAVKFISHGAANGYGLGYADAVDNDGIDEAAPATIVREGGYPLTYYPYVGLATTTAGFHDGEYAVDFLIPTGKYINFVISSAVLADAYIWGYEE